MQLIDRVKNIVLQPQREWEVIAGESAGSAELYRDYVIPLAAIGPVASFIGLSLVGTSLPLVGTFRVPIPSGLAMAVVGYAMALAGVFVLALIIDYLAPHFGGEKNPLQALKVAAYSATPVWVAGVLQILPMLGILVMLAGLYALYLVYLGLPRLMKAPADRALPYTAVVAVCAVIVAVIAGSASHAFMPGMAMPHMYRGG
jgi:hypothetical protein